MPLYVPTAPLRYLGPLVDYLQSTHPRATARALAAAGIQQGFPRDSAASISISSMDALLQELALATGRDDLGFELGQRITLDLHGALTPALRRCGTVDELLRVTARYFRLITPSYFVDYRRHKDRAELVYRPAAAMTPQTLHMLHEAHAVAVHTQLKALLRDRLTGYDIYLSMDAPRHVARYRDLRPVRFHFEQQRLPAVRVVIGTRLLVQPLRLPGRGEATGIADDPDGLAWRPGRAARWSDWCRMMLREAEGCQPSLDDLAKLLNVSSRTLSRHLTSEGEGIRELASQVRHQRACEMLCDHRQSISGIAYRLGYENVANFSRAFRGMHGGSPRSYRRFVRP